MLPFDEYFVVEFSLSQNCFHKHTVKKMIETNRMNIFKRRKTDYLPVGYFETNEDADRFINETMTEPNNYIEKKTMQMLREKKGLSIKEVEEKAGLPHNSLSGIETGKWKSTNGLWKLAKFYGIELNKDILVEYGIIVKK